MVIQTWVLADIFSENEQNKPIISKENYSVSVVNDKNSSFRRDNSSSNLIKQKAFPNNDCDLIYLL